MRCSFVFPEAPLMVQATIIFLFRICLGVLINLLRIHYSIYQNNGTLLGDHIYVKRMNLLQNWASGGFFRIWFSARAEETSIGPALHYSAGRKCTVSGCCLVIRRRNREAFQVMTVLVFKRFECLEHKKTLLWRSGVTRATLTSQVTIKLLQLCTHSQYCILPCSPSGQFRLEASLQVGIGVGTILIHLDPITPSVLGPFDVA